MKPLPTVCLLLKFNNKMWLQKSTIRLVIALAVEHGMYIHQIDVSSAHLNGGLRDEVYIRQSEGFIDELRNEN